MIKGRKGRQNFVNKSNQFCQDILSLGIARPESLVNLVMALSSYEYASHPVELSESKFFARKYYSIYRSIQELAKDSESYEKVCKSIGDLCLKYSEIVDNHYDLQTDVTPICKPHSPCLEERTHISVPNNVIAGNKSLSQGYNYSYVNLSLNQPDYLKQEEAYSKSANTKWTAPVSIVRVGLNQTARSTALGQIKTLFEDKDLPFGKADLVSNVLDSYYGNVGYLSSVHQYKNLVSIVRLRGSMKIYPEDRNSDTGGAPKIYGECHYLIEQSGIHHYKRKGEDKEKYRKSVLELPCREKFSFETKTAKGKLLRVHIRRFNSMMFRSQNQYNMKDKPFGLLYVRIFDETKRKPLFKPMWLAISGEKRNELTSFQAYCKYSHRYDIEPFFRFSKQKLLLDKYQTSSLAYLDNWVLITQMAAWLLWTASDEALKNPKDWQKYLPEYKTEDMPEKLVEKQLGVSVELQKPKEGQVNECLIEYKISDKTEKLVEKQLGASDCQDKLKDGSVKINRLTIAQTRKGAETLFSTFDKNPFAVQKSNKGKGRKKGTKLDVRKRYKVVRKGGNLVQNRAT